MCITIYLPIDRSVDRSISVSLLLTTPTIYSQIHSLFDWFRRLNTKGMMISFILHKKIKNKIKGKWRDTYQNNDTSQDQFEFKENAHKKKWCIKNADTSITFSSVIYINEVSCSHAIQCPSTFTFTVKRRFCPACYHRSFVILFFSTIFFLFFPNKFPSQSCFSRIIYKIFLSFRSSCRRTNLWNYSYWKWRD